MNNLIFWIKNNKRSIIYSVFLLCSFELILRVLLELGIGRYVTVSVLFCMLLVGELSYGMLFIRKRYTRDEVGHVIWPLMSAHLLHQFILPLMLYLGTVVFLFFYPRDLLAQIMIFIATVTYCPVVGNVESII